VEDTYITGSTYKTYNLTPELSVNNTYVWFNGKWLDKKYTFIATTRYIQQ
jgi:hypothetical protein